MKLKSQCCRKFERKPKSCKHCPLVACLDKKKRKRRIRKLRAELTRAA